MLYLTRRRLSRKSSHLTRDHGEVLVGLFLFIIVGSMCIILSYVDPKTSFIVFKPFLIGVYGLSTVILIGLIYRMISMVYTRTEDQLTQTDHSIGQMIREYITKNRAKVMAYCRLDEPAQKNVATQVENIYDVPKRSHRRINSATCHVQGDNIYDIPQPRPVRTLSLNSINDVVQSIYNAPKITRTTSLSDLKGLITTDQLMLIKWNGKKNCTIQQGNKSEKSFSTIDSGIAKTSYTKTVSDNDSESEQDPLKQIGPSTSGLKTIIWADKKSEDNDVRTHLVEIHHYTDKSTSSLSESIEASRL